MTSDPNRIETGQEIAEQTKSEVISHPLSPQLENQRMSKDSGSQVQFSSYQILFQNEN